MALTEFQLQELKIAFATWRSIEMIEGRPYPAADAFDAVFPIAVRYGALQDVRSSWARAVFEAERAGAISLNPPVEQPPEIDQVFRDEVRRMPSNELLKKINGDSGFKRKFDALALETTAPQQVNADDYSSFTASDWHALPQETLARLMARPAFRKRIDALAAAKLI